MRTTSTTLRKRERCPADPLHQAYVSLAFAAPAADGSKQTAVARFGAFEVRLVELPRDRASDTSLFWIELYRHDTQTSLDSCRCDDLDDAELALQHLIVRARGLHRSPQRS